MERNFDGVFVHRETLECALTQCLPCLYKINPTGIWNDGGIRNSSRNSSCSSDKEPLKGDVQMQQYQYQSQYRLPPNQRPECCPRSKSERFLGPYNKRQRILTLGDGDFSFSLSVGRHLSHSHCPKHLIATSHESHRSVMSTYTTSEAILSELHSLGAKVLHEVDATDLANTLIPSFDAKFKKCHIVLWNFPCVRAPQGADGQVEALNENRLLLRKFFNNVSIVLKDKKMTAGEVHVTHKTIEPFSWWDIEGIAMECGFECIGRLIFDRTLYPGYINRKVLDKKSFPLNDALTYVFRKRNCDKGAISPTMTHAGIVAVAAVKADLMQVVCSMGTKLALATPETGTGSGTHEMSEPILHSKSKKRKVFDEQSI